MLQKPRLANLSGVARTFSLPREWFRQEADAGRIPCIRAGTSYLFNIEAVREALAERAAAPLTSEVPSQPLSPTDEGAAP